MLSIKILYEEGVIMIKGMTTVRFDDVEYNIDISFSMSSQKFEIVIPFNSQQDCNVADYLLGERFSEIVFINVNGQVFTAYDCVCIRRITNIETITIIGRYKTLIKGWKIPKCGIVMVHFDGIERFFKKYSQTINPNYVLDGENWNIVNAGEKIYAYVSVSNFSNIDFLLSLMIKVREYFEFLVDSEILVDQAVYFDDSGNGIEILNDELLISKNFYVFDKESVKIPEKIMEGLNKWLAQYKTYEEVILIWKKTIYNKHVSAEDVFIWRCQALELLCTLYAPLFSEAKACIQQSKQVEPNLVNFLEALSKKHKFIECETFYFYEVKNVRNVYTHYNPQKHITEREWWNSSHLIVMALNVALQYVFDLDVKEEDFFILVPPGTMDEIRR